MRIPMVAGDNHFINERYRVALHEVLLESYKVKGVTSVAKEKGLLGENIKQLENFRLYVEGRIRLALNK